MHERLRESDTIVKGIKGALDAQKKSVRSAAVECRNAWILLN